MKLATFETDGYELLDCVVRNAETPTFQVPKMEWLQRLRAGQHAKLVFLLAPEIAGRVGYPSAERMWVRIQHQEGPLFYGVLDNIPAYFEEDALEHGDEVVFELRHVASIDPDEHPNLADAQ